MKSVVGRRVFVGSVAAGLPLIAGAGARALGQSGTVDGGPLAHAGHAGGDPLQTHLLGEMAKTYNRMRRGLRGEDARIFASNLRTLAVYGRQHDLDASVRAAVRKAIEEQGRDVFLQREPDAAGMRAELERYGFEPDDRTRHLVPGHDPLRRSAAIDTLLSEGVTPALDRLAALFEQAAPAIDRRNGSLVNVGLVRQDAAYWAGFCATLWAHYLEAQQIAIAGCAFVSIPFIGVVFSPACGALQGGAAATLLMYIWYC